MGHGWMDVNSENEVLARELEEARRELAACRAQRVDLERQVEALRGRLADAAHDLKSPLTVILSYAELLLEGGEQMSAEARGDLEAIALGARQLAELVTEKLAPPDAPA